MRTLVIAPHPDDEIIGVGGTICKKLQGGDSVYVCVVTKGCLPLFGKESVNVVRNETFCCHTELGVNKTFFLDFPASMLESVRRFELNKALIDVIKEVCPDEVYIPHCGDMQKDHQIVAEACMVALRPKYSFSPKKIYAYETLSETGWNIPNIQNEFIPNVFVDITCFLNDKINAMQCYKSQLSEFPDARSIKAIESLALYRGALMNVGAAEAFMLIREMK